MKTELEQIGQRIGELSNAVYENQKSFFEFYELSGNVVYSVSFSRLHARIVWRNSITQSVQTLVISLDNYCRFIDHIASSD